MNPIAKNLIASEKKPDIYIDPSYDVFNSDELFNQNNLILNRDDQLLPYCRLRDYLIGNGRSVHTADFLPGINNDSSGCEYYSLGILSGYKDILINQRARLSAFVIMEPPVVAPNLYAALPELTKYFDRVYVHNIDGDGYSLKNVDQKKLHRLYWPIPYDNVLLPIWENNSRMKKIVVINGNHNPRSRIRELYSMRINAMVDLTKLGVIDLYGHGWSKLFSRQALWGTYLLNRKSLLSIYKGPCKSKFEVLKNYEFCLCFENMTMNGYISEKIFDCIYAGTIPLYLGAPDISKYIPSSVYIDCNRFSSWKLMWESVKALTNSEILAMKVAGRKYLASDEAKLFFNSMKNIVDKK